MARRAVSRSQTFYESILDPNLVTGCCEGYQCGLKGAGYGPPVQADRLLLTSLVYLLSDCPVYAVHNFLQLNV